MKGNSKGASFNDRELAAKVRSLGLEEIKKILEQKKMNELKKQVLLRIAPALLPRLSEVTGADGKELPIPIFNLNVPTNNSVSSD